jgi:hypothetical protein
VWATAAEAAAHEADLVRVSCEGAMRALVECKDEAKCTQAGMALTMCIADQVRHTRNAAAALHKHTPPLSLPPLLSRICIADQVRHAHIPKTYLPASPPPPPHNVPRRPGKPMQTHYNRRSSSSTLACWPPSSPMHA